MNNENDVYAEHLHTIVNFTNERKSGNVASKVIKKYAELEKLTNSDLATMVAEELRWIAEVKKNYKSLKEAADFLLDENVIKIFLKYKEDVANEVAINVFWTFEDFMLNNSLDMENVNNYVQWLNNGHMSKLLNFTSQFSGFQNIEMRKNIFSILDITPTKTGVFDRLVSEVDQKKVNLEKKVELAALIKDLVNIEKDEYAEILVSGGMKKLIQVLRRNLKGIKIPYRFASVKYSIKFLDDMKKNPNIHLLFKKNIENSEIKNWLMKDETTRGIIDEMEKIGLDTSIYISSGKKILETKAEGYYGSWKAALENIVIKILGSKKNRMLPKISIKNSKPGSIFKAIKSDYSSAMNQDKESGLKVLNTLKEIITKNYPTTGYPRNIKDVLNDIDCLEKIIPSGGVVSFRGAKVKAMVWKRKIPEDLYDSNVLRCCCFLPEGEFKEEIPLLMMDPQTTLLQFCIEGVDVPVAVAFFYAGKCGGESTLLMDTWDAGGIVYSALGHEKMKNFVLEAMKEFTRAVGAKKLLIFAKAAYGRPEEFCNFLRDKEYETKEVDFEAIDVKDSVLKKHSKNLKHHYTDAYGSDTLKPEPLKGKFQAFVFEM